MIKVKIFNPSIGRNEPTFRPFWFIKNKLRDSGGVFGAAMIMDHI